jgi:hypothetical protein
MQARLPSRMIMAVCGGLLLGVFADEVVARHQATIVLRNGQRATGIVRYMAASRSYEISVPNGPTREIRADEIANVILAQPPAQLETALQAVQRANYQQAIPILTTIVADYAMFGPDIQAGEALLQAYVRSSRAEEAVRVGDEIIRRNPEAQQRAAFAGAYWEALLELGRTAALRTAIEGAISSGSRELAAAGLLRRGDLEMRDNRPREALVDGYLRVILLFRDIAIVQPEALFKAIRAHEALNEVAYAERWRQRLLTTYGTSEFAQKLR